MISPEGSRRRTGDRRRTKGPQSDPAWVAAMGRRVRPGVVGPALRAALLVVVPAEGVEAACCSAAFAAGGRDVCALSVRCMRSCRPFSCGEAGWMKCGSTPSSMHNADRRVRPPAPLDPNGAPLRSGSRAAGHEREMPLQRPAAILRSSAARSAHRSENDCGHPLLSEGRSGCGLSCGTSLCSRWPTRRWPRRPQ